MTPRRDADWTDGNAHDPGVTLLEAIVYDLADLGAGVARRLRIDRCGWRCALLVAAGTAGVVLLARRRR